MPGEDEETGGDAYATEGSSWRAGRAPPGPVAEQVDSRPPSDQLRRRPAMRTPSSSSQGPRPVGPLPPLPTGRLEEQMRKPALESQPEQLLMQGSRFSSGILGIESSTAANKTRDDRPPFALINVDLRSVPKVDTERQSFKVDMDVKLHVHIPELSPEPFIFSGRIATPVTDGGSISEELELRNFPLDVQRLHVEYVFELDEDSLGKDVSRVDVMERLYHLQSATARDNEWALYREAVEIYAHPMSNDRLSVEFVLITRRRPIFYAINVVLPVWCIVLFSFISFSFKASELERRLSVTLTMVLTLVAFKLSVSTAKYVPITSRMTLMDWFMIMAFVVVALVALQNFLAFNNWTAAVPIGLWVVTNLAMAAAVSWAVLTGDAVERVDDDRRFDEEGYDLVANVLTEGAKGDRAIEELWSKHGASACLALEIAARRLANMDEAESQSRRALLVTEKMMHSDHQYTLSSRFNLACVLFDRGRLGAATHLHRDVLRVRLEELGKEHLDSLQSLHSLDALARWQGGKPQLDESEQLYRRALEGRQKVLGDEHPDTLTSLNNLADVVAKQGRLDEASQLYQRALEGRRKVLGNEHPDTLKSINSFAYALLRHADEHPSDVDMSLVEALLKSVLAVRQKVLSDDHPDMLQSLNNLAYVLSKQPGKLMEAEANYRRVLAVRQRKYGDWHPETLESLENLAIVLDREDKLEEAAHMYGRALAACQKQLRDEQPGALSYLNHLAEVLAKQGRLGNAELKFRRVLAGRQKALGYEHPDTLASLGNLADVDFKQPGRLDEAEQLARSALEGRQKVLGAEHPDTLSSLSSLVCVLNAQGKVVDAEECFRRALAGRQGALGPDHEDTLASCDSLAEFLCTRGGLDEAQALYTSALEGRERKLGDKHPETLRSIDCLAEFLSKRGKLVDAEALFRRALAGRRRVWGPDHTATLESLSSLAAALASQGKVGEAEQLYRRALEGRLKVLGPDDPQTLESLGSLADLLSKQGELGDARPVLAGRQRARGVDQTESLKSLGNRRDQGTAEEAAALYRRVFAGRQKALGDEHPDTLAALKSLADALAKLPGRLDEAKQLRGRYQRAMARRV
ncbi:hypothetical protein FOA52_015514 [Chlamydomonas sp. UWO 241]|nr:hypothetical protein FOA52_015514 [Chlamydomonas sp. UWO 241]